MIDNRKRFLLLGWSGIGLVTQGAAGITIPGGVLEAPGSELDDVVQWLQWQCWVEGWT